MRILHCDLNVAGFSDLMIEDQMALLKASFMELNVLRLSYRWAHIWMAILLLVCLPILDQNRTEPFRDSSGPIISFNLKFI